VDIRFSGPRLDPEKDFRNHRMPWEMKYRGFGDPQSHPGSDSDFAGQSEYVQGAWENERVHTTAPGTDWIWPRCSAVGQDRIHFQWGENELRMWEHAKKVCGGHARRWWGGEFRCRTAGESRL
jgi:hypothetical protein